MPQVYEDHKRYRIWKEFILNDSSLEAAYRTLYDKCTVLLAEIPRFFPSYSDHSIDHIHELWTRSDILAGADFFQNSEEVFIYGGALLFHDAAMSLPAVGGIKGIKADRARWRAELRRQFDQAGEFKVGEEQLTDPPVEIEKAAVIHLLRDLHAENAAKLYCRELTFGTDKWRLFDDPELGHVYGPLIGTIAATHGLSLRTAEDDLRALYRDRTENFFPITINAALKLACLLRCADAIHVDETRVPLHLRIFREPEGESQLHYLFQAKIAPATVDIARRLVCFKNIEPFQADEIGAWWLAYDHIKYASYELYQSDCLLRDLGLPRLTANSIDKIEFPERFAECVVIHDVRPADLRPSISNVAKVIRGLGGNQLYGEDYTVPLRELLQNACDATLARKQVDPTFSDDDYDVIVSFRGNNSDWQLCVSDRGFGMDVDTIKNYLLDFGQSYWKSDRMIKDHPQIAASGMNFCGKFGIGFYSVFMVTRRVSIQTRRYNERSDVVHELYFEDGINQRPLLRDVPADKIFRSITSVTLFFENDSDGILRQKYMNSLNALSRALPVRLKVISEGRLATLCEPNDWMAMPIENLLERFQGFRYFGGLLPDILRPLYYLDKNGKPTPELAGRLCFTLPFIVSHRERTGWLTAGYFPVYEFIWLGGILKGEPENAARNKACLDVKKVTWEAWLKEQCDICSSALEHSSDVDMQILMASILLRFGSEPWRLKLFEVRGVAITPNELVSRLSHRDEVDFLLGKRPLSLAFTRPPFECYYAEPFELKRPHDETCFKNLLTINIHEFFLNICVRAWGKVITTQIQYGHYRFKRDKGSYPPRLFSETGFSRKRKS